MHEHIKTMFNDAFNGIPNELLQSDRTHNSMWGKEYIVFLNKRMNYDEIEMLIENMLIMRFIRL